MPETPARARGLPHGRGLSPGGETSCTVTYGIVGKDTLRVTSGLHGEKK